MQNEQHAHLAAAYEQRQLARANLEKADVELNRAQQTSNQYRAKADEATRIANASGIADALQLEHVRRDAEALAAAAKRELDAAQATRNEKQQQLEAADVEVRTIAERLLWAEINAQMDDFRATFKKLQQLRTSLFGAYLVSPNALADQEWHALDCRSLLSAEAMQIGLPMVCVSLTNGRDLEELAPDPRPHRARVNGQQAAWTERLAELERGEPIAEATRDAA